MRNVAPAKPRRRRRQRTGRRRSRSPAARGAASPPAPSASHPFPRPRKPSPKRKERLAAPPATCATKGCAGTVSPYLNPISQIYFEIYFTRHSLARRCFHLQRSPDLRARHIPTELRAYFRLERQSLKYCGCLHPLFARFSNHEPGRDPDRTRKTLARRHRGASPQGVRWRRVPHPDRRARSMQGFVRCRRGRGGHQVRLHRRTGTQPTRRPGGEVVSHQLDRRKDRLDRHPHEDGYRAVRRQIRTPRLRSLPETRVRGMDAFGLPRAPSISLPPSCTPSPSRGTSNLRWS